jgi:hypothetical protein
MSTVLTRALAALVALSLVSSAANAAEIWADKPPGKRLIVFVKGDIERGDQDKFAKVTAKLPPGTIVALGSIGGALADGLNMGITIRNKRFNTIVVKTCQSVCALMWLAGVERAVFADGSIGFHSAYDGKTGAVVGGGNAVVGAYLSRLGYSYETIAALTNAAPDDMDWLDDAKAKKYGIKVVVLPASKS